MAAKKKIRLPLLETDVEAGTFLRAEELFDNGSVQKVSRLEPHLWIITVLDVHDHEVEVLMTTRGILKGHSCDCPNDAQGSPCAHVVTSLLHIRKNQKTPVLRQKKKASLPKMLSIPAVMVKITSQELQEFIINYAKKDKKFGDELKLQYADQIQTIDDDQKYNLALDQIFKTHIDRHNKISRASARYFLRVGGVLTDKIEALLAYEDYAEVIKIIFPLLSKAYVILKKSDPNNQALIDFIINTHKLLRSFINEMSAPEITEQVYDKVVILGDYSFYRLLNPIDNIFLIATRSEKFNIYHDAVYIQLKEITKRKPEDINACLMTMAQYLIDRNDHKGLSDLINEYNDSTILFTYISQTLKENKASPSDIIDTFAAVQDSTWPITLKSKKSKLLVHAYAVSGQSDQAFELALNAYRVTKDKNILDAFTPSKKIPFGRTRKTVSEHPRLSDTLKADILLYFGIRSLSGERLRNFLYNDTTLADLIALEPAYLINRNVDITALFKIKVNQYLNNHFGEQAREYIYFVLRKLDNYQIDKLRRDIISDIQDKFAGRQGLKELFN